MLYKTLISNLILVSAGFSSGKDIKTIRFVLDQPVLPIAVQQEKDGYSVRLVNDDTNASVWQMNQNEGKSIPILF